MLAPASRLSYPVKDAKPVRAALMISGLGDLDILNMTQYEYAINGLTPEMNLDGRKATIPRVESNVSYTGPLMGEVLPRKGKVQQAERKDITTIQGFGGVTFYTLDLILDPRRAQRIQLKDTKGNNLTSCTEILERNKQLVNEYNAHIEDEIKITTNQENIFDYDLADVDKLEYNGIQEVSDVGKTPTKAEVAKLLRNSVREDV